MGTNLSPLTQQIKVTLFDFQMFLLSKNALLKFSTGHVIDLVSNDVQRLEEDTVKLFFLVPFAFTELTLVSVLLVFLIGWQTLMGVIFLCFLVPYFAGLSYAGAALRLRIAAVSDRRISLINQVVSGIRAIKTHAWEDEYRVKIKNTRRYRELKKYSNVANGANVGFGNPSTFLLQQNYLKGILAVRKCLV